MSDPPPMLHTSNIVQPPLPTAGLDPWDVALNDYLAALDARIAALEASPAAKTLVNYALVSQTAPPPSSNAQMRTDNAVMSQSTHIYVASITDDGININNMLNLVTIGQVLYIQDRVDDTKWARYTVTASTPVMTGLGYQDFTVTPLSNSGIEISKSNVKVVMVLPQ